MSYMIPRLSMSTMAPKLAEILNPRVKRLGYLGEFFQCTAHQPEALISFMAFTEDLKRALPDRLTEVVALSVACLYDNAYERIQHERLCLARGFGERWVREVISLEQERQSELTEQELAVQKLVKAMVERKGHDTSSELEAVIKALGHKQAVAILLLIGRYIAHSMIVNCLRLAPPVASPLNEDR